MKNCYSMMLDFHSFHHSNSGGVTEQIFDNSFQRILGRFSRKTAGGITKEYYEELIEGFLKIFLKSFWKNLIDNRCNWLWDLLVYDIFFYLFYRLVTIIS